jgi:hypothetical protein
MMPLNCTNVTVQNARQRLPNFLPRQLEDAVIVSCTTKAHGFPDSTIGAEAEFMLLRTGMQHKQVASYSTTFFSFSES